MRQILQIFAKDVRRMAVPIVVLAALIAAADFDEILARLHPQNGNSHPTQETILTLLPFFWLLLIAGVVLQERIPGTRQYWLTRPISRMKLLAAKVLFAGIFVNLLWFASDCVIVASLGFSLHPFNLLVRQAAMCVLLFLPVFALASTLKSLGQLALGVLFSVGVAIAELILPSLLFHANGFALNGPSLLDFLPPVTASLAALVIFLQFGFRATVFSRIVFGFLLLVLPLAFWQTLSANFEVLRGLPATNQVESLTMSLDFASDRLPGKTPAAPFSGLQFPLVVRGLPSDVYMDSSGGGNLLATGQSADHRYAFQTVTYSDRNGDWLRFSVEKQQIEALAARVNVQSELTANLFRIQRQTNVAVNAHDPFSAAPDTMCQAAFSGNAAFHCWRPSGVMRQSVLQGVFEKNGESIQLEPGGEPKRSWTFSPIVDWDLYARPSAALVFDPTVQIRFQVLRPIGSKIFHLNASQIDPAPYIVTP